MGAALVPAALTGLAVFTQAQGTAAADRFKSEQLTAKAEAGRTAAAQTDSALRDELHTTISNITAIRASTGENPYSPTGAAIMEQNTEESDRQRKIRVGNLMAQVGLDEQGSGFYKHAVTQALFSGGIGAAAAGFKSLSSGVPKAA